MGQWHVSGYVGGASILESDLRVRQSASHTFIRFSDIKFDSRSFQPPLYYGFRAGYDVSRALGWELELIHLKAFARLASNEFLSRFNLSHGANLFLGNAVARRQITRRVTFAGRFGAGFTIPHAETIVLGSTREEYELSGPAFQVAGGTELLLARRFSWIGEYKFSYTGIGVGEPDVRIDTALYAHHFVTGLTYRFGPP